MGHTYPLYTFRKPCLQEEFFMQIICLKVSSQKQLYLGEYHDINFPNVCLYVNKFIRIKLH